MRFGIVKAIRNRIKTARPERMAASEPAQRKPCAAARSVRADGFSGVA